MLCGVRVGVRFYGWGVLPTPMKSTPSCDLLATALTKSHNLCYKATQILRQGRSLKLSEPVFVSLNLPDGDCEM